MIAELDEKKREALEKTWIKVNQDFGAIFSTLLPGTSAKLDPIEGQPFLNGTSQKFDLLKPESSDRTICHGKMQSLSWVVQVWRSKSRLLTSGKSL